MPWLWPRANCSSGGAPQQGFSRLLKNAPKPPQGGSRYPPAADGFVSGGHPQTPGRGAKPLCTPLSSATCWGSSTSPSILYDVSPGGDSHRVAKYLQSVGYRIIPVNPVVDEVLGEKSYPDLKSVPVPIDMVDIFRRSELVAPVVDEAIQVKAKFIWMQDGVVNEEAAEKARGVGIPVIMNN
ncbi:MAG: CoA-binding protein [Chloroflexi bacterium]|nr:CoA-binding protein [Chloroflexota bacterium]